ncbi:MAG: DUF3667 domain-containing protein [Flavobacteriales bacterium]|nr:DUF3667 domain-containing protein [Flavobacteriales bacterium]
MGNRAKRNPSTKLSNTSPNRLSVWRREAVTIKKPHTYRRFTVEHILEDAADTFLLNKGILFTCRELLLRPRDVVEGFLDTERERYTHPVKYFILAAGIYLFILLKADLYDIGAMVVNAPDIDAQKTGIELMQKYFLNYLNAWMGVSIFFFALMTRLFFRKARFNYAEHLIINTYLLAQITVFYILLSPLAAIQGIWGHQLIESIVAVVFTCFFYGRVFRLGIGGAIGKSILVYLSATLIFMFAVMLFFSLIGLVAGLTS